MRAPPTVVTEPTTMDSVTADLVAIAQCHRARNGREDAWPADLSQLADLAVVVDEGLCRDIADRFERAPGQAYDDALAARYDRVKRESRDLYEDVVAAGFAVEPWARPGQPYGDSDELAQQVRETRTIRVLLTRDVHGPPGSSGFHPMREPSGVRAGGVELLHNDLVRAVHDLFGHVMFGTGFGPRGELKAAYCHMALHSEDARAALFTEHVTQICWFYFGPQLRDAAGKLRRPGDPGYVPPHARPYPEQKVYAANPEDLVAFQRMFKMGV